MIPKITQVAPNPIISVILQFFNILKEQGFSGDSTINYADRLIMSTDNSIYQLLPDAVLFPYNRTDVQLIARFANEPAFAALTFTPRGGGTGTNGQSLNQGIIIDMSRYMNHILDINIKKSWVRVEAGVVKDQLNQYLKPFGYFFSPELSTSNRATLGGMISTDASGQGSLVYGKTSDHILAIQAVLLGGDIIDTYPISIHEAESIAAHSNVEANIYRVILKTCFEKRLLILDKFPKLNRFLTGYDLRHVLSDDLQKIDLTRILCGAEGTLAFIVEAQLNITPIPKVRCLVNIKYNSFESALRHAPFMIKAKALSVETVDSNIINLAKEDIIWHSVEQFITDVPNKNMLGLNIIEFAGNNKLLLDKQVAKLCQTLDKFIIQQLNGVIGYHICKDINAIESIYSMRKKAVGLLGNAKGRAKPIPFIEDTCVPPQHLADYIIEFRALLDSYNLNYGMFGHVDSGVLHVRPIMDMCDPYQDMLVKQISDKVVALTLRYSGLLWGEHGKGFRSEYSTSFFGDELYHELRCIKSAFDPKNKLNPGKICTPIEIDTPIVQVNAIKRGKFDRQIPISIRDSWHQAIECNGNGLCFNFDTKSYMCPSMKITANRIHSPKGRAILTREWLRLMANQGYNLLSLEKKIFDKRISLITIIKRICNTWQAKNGQYDFSHEVKDAMLSCLCCKSCSTECPIKIDVPNFRSRFLQLYYTRYLRPAGDYLIGSIETYVPLIAKLPKIFNFLLCQHWFQSFNKKYFGIIDLPLLSSPSLKNKLYSQLGSITKLNELEKMSIQKRIGYVLVVQDPFTSYYEANIIYDFVKLIKKLGFHPVVLPFLPNGKSLYVKGFLKKFTQTAKKTASFLNRIAQLGIPMVGVDPAMVLCYRYEYQHMLAEQRGDFQVYLVHEWLQQILVSSRKLIHQEREEVWYLFSHCTEVTHLPNSIQYWKNIFTFLGKKLESVNVGCCGMAGSYGHEIYNLKQSLGIYALSWQKMLHDLPVKRCLATGYSCRNQVKRVDGYVLRHPLQALLEIL